MKKQMKEVSKIDWARLAAYIDGEGCILIKSNKPRITLGDVNERYHERVIVANTDARLIVWLKETFGVGNVTTHQLNLTPGHRMRRLRYDWEVTCKDAVWILQGTLPYFVIKREQAEVCLTLRKTFAWVRNAKGQRQPNDESQIRERRRIKSRLQDLKEEVHPLLKVS
jgi:hypothetical protein